MTSRPFLTVTLAAAIAVGPVTEAAADAGNLVGGIVGGIIGGAIVNGANNRRVTTTRRVYTTPSVTSATRAANRETQTALNYFGYGAGTPDGVLGRRSRAAISSYQAFMNMPVTGKLTQFERDILVGAYNRGVTGSYETMQLVSKDPMGAKALLVAQRDMLTGGTTPRRTVGYAGLPLEVSQAVDEIAESSDPSPEQLLQRSGFIQLADLNGDGNTDYILDTSFSGSSFWCSAVQCKTIVFASTSNGYARNDLLAFDPTPASFDCIGSSCRVAAKPETSGSTVMASAEPEVAVPEVTTSAVTTLAGLGTLPIISPAEPKSSLASYCSKVSLMTNANGGFTNASQMTNPDQVMGEQFCLARAFAMDESERIVSGLQGVTQAQVDAQCAAYGPALTDYVTSLSVKPRDGVVSGMKGFVMSSGMDPAQLAPTAKVCLGVGYRKDDMDIVLGSALLMVALGQEPYSELVGHHLSQGFGPAKNTGLALPWYDSAIEAIYAGDEPVFAPGQTQRTGLIEAAVLMMSGDDRASTKPASAKGTSVLPTFSIKE